MRSGADREANLDQATALIEEAAAAGADLVALPEVLSWRGPKAQEAAQAESLDGPSVSRLSAAARKAGVWLVGGSFLERSSEDGRCFNTATLFARDGSLTATYRKIHLFDIDLPGAVSIRESDTRAAGDAPCCIDTPLGKIGLAICYDLRFPELFRALMEKGAEIVVMPSAFTLPTGRCHWHPLIRARAIENQCFFIAPNQYGQGSEGFAEYGHSLVVDPWGTILAEAPEAEQAVLIADCEAAALSRVRRDLPALDHRRLSK